MGYAVFDYNAASDTFTRHRHAAAGERRQVRVTCHTSEDERLRVYRVLGSAETERQELHVHDPSARQRPRRPSSSSPRSSTSDPAVRSSLATARTSTRVHRVAPLDADVTGARAASGSAFAATGPIPTASMTTTDSNIWEAARATPTRSRGGPTERPTWTPSWSVTGRTSKGGRSGSCSGPSARRFGKGIWKHRQGHRSAIAIPLKAAFKSGPTSRVVRACGGPLISKAPLRRSYCF